MLLELLVSEFYTVLSSASSYMAKGLSTHKTAIAKCIAFEQVTEYRMVDAVLTTLLTIGLGLKNT